MRVFRSPARRVRLALAGITLLATVALPAPAQEYPRLNRPDAFFRVEPEAEIGFLKVFTHTIQVGEDGTAFDYVTQGGQELLYPYKRFAINMDIGRRNYLRFLYQPLTIETTTRVDGIPDADGTPQPVQFDDVTFPVDEGLRLKYGFDFYRVTYHFDAVARPALTVGVGASLQLRNASLVFESTTGEEIVVSQDLGPVPVLAGRVEYDPQRGVLEPAFFELEADGFYASSAFINGAEYDFTGSIFDVGLTAGYEANPATDLYLTLRVVGGGAEGTRPEDERTVWTQSRSGFTDNFLTLGALSVGARLK
ncbi:MAG: hypothetical protein ACOCYG_02350 [Spirochaetota bacterium]